MPNTRTNLVPFERQRDFSRTYVIRLGTVAALFGIAFTIAAAFLLVPHYVYLATSLNTKEARLSALAATVDTAEEKELSERLMALAADANNLLALKEAPSASRLLKSFLGISRPGVTLAGLRYEAPAGSTGELEVTGTAATREALRAYQLALSRQPFVRSAELPVSAYAKDSNIPFSITLTLAPAATWNTP